MFKFWRLTPAIALATAAALLVAGTVFAIYSEQLYRSQKAREIGVQADILASSVTAALVFNDPKTVQEYVNAMRANPKIEIAGVYDATNRLVASYSRFGDEVAPRAPEPRTPYFEDKHLIAVASAGDSGESVGTVYLQTVTEPLASRLARHAGIALLVTMASLLFVVLAIAQRAMARTNAELETKAFDLARANRDLQEQMAERAKAEEALRHAQKMEAIGQLSGGIAHDFNNLLAIISGNLQLLQRRIRQGRTDVQRYVDLAMEGVNRASNVTQRVLAFSRRQPLSPTPVRLSVLVAGAADLLRHSVGGAVAVETQLEADWWTLCDPGQMENVILNLAINARDAMPDGGRMTIETANVAIGTHEDEFSDAASGEYVQLSVTDTGCGMPEDVRKRAIDPFFTTKPLGQGTGLGLSMIYGYVKQSGGYLYIRSEVGKGTTITILMPRHDAPLADAPAARDREAPPAVDGPGEERRATILLVEDEALVRMLAAETIRDEGYNVLEEGHGDAAMELLRSDAAIDLLITDVKLPGFSGYTLAQTGLALRPSLKILLMTGYAQEAIPESLVAAGAEMLHKPYSVEQLVTLAARLLAERSPV